MNLSVIGNKFTNRNYPFLREALIILFFAVLVFLIYSNTIHSPFVFDDRINIKVNHYLRLTKLSLQDIRLAAFEGPSKNRPIVKTSFALNYFFHQYNVMGYHLVNILVHLANGILLYLFVKTTLSLPVLRLTEKSQKWIPYFTALIWLVHPIQTQSVTYIVQRMNSMAAMFYLLSIFLYTKARLAELKVKRILLFTGCIFTGLLAIGSKEIAATLPFFIFLYEWYFFQDLNYIWIRRRFFIIGGLLVFLAIAAFMYLGINPLDKLLSSYEKRDFTLTQRVLTEFRVVIFYLSLFLFPHPSRLNLTHDFSLSNSMIDPVTTLLSIAATVGMVVLAFKLARKERLLSFCILWFLGNLVIESSVISLEIIFEHRTYLPSMLLSLLFAMLIQRYLKPNQLRIPLVCILVVIFSFWTFERNSVWKSRISLWQDSMQKSMELPRPHHNLGFALVEEGRLDEAIEHYKAALQVKPDYIKAHNSIGRALFKQGKNKEAVEYFYEALKIKPDFEKAHSNLGLVLVSEGKIEEGIKHLSEALRIKPNYVQAHNSMGKVLLKQGKIKEAIEHLSKALQPGYADPFNNMGDALARIGRHKEALTFFNKAIKINPNFAEAHNAIGFSFVKLGKIDMAINYFFKALKINPSLADTHYNLGTVFRKQGKSTKAIVHFSEALRIKPRYLKAHNNLGITLATQGKFEEAIGHFSEAIRIDPDDKTAHYNMELALRKVGRFSESETATQ